VFQYRIKKLSYSIIKETYEFFPLNVCEFFEAILAVKKNDSVKGVSLSKDHTAGKESEQKRIAKTAGFVQNNRVLGILEVSRSFGDPSFKKNGVICVPRNEIVSY